MMGGEKLGKKNGEGEEKVPLFKLFSFADTKDKMLMAVGTVAAIANGLSMPLMTFLFGELINAFSDPHVVHAVSKVAIKFVYLAIGSGVVSCLQVSCWMITGERQSTRIRGLYLKTILRQDITFFDMETTTGEVIGRMSGDTILIQDAMGEKVGKFIQLISTFIGGFVIAFVKGWLLALVMLSCIPLIVISCGGMAVVILKMSTKCQKAYAESGNVVEQTIGSIRTVASFTAEKLAMEKYEKTLVAAYEATIRQGLANGLGIGSILLIIFSSYGLAIWYGSTLILHHGYSGGQVINVLMAIMMGGMSLGQASPSLNAFATGRAAAYKMFNTINRKPEIDAYDTRGSVLEDIKGDVELRDVHFSYPARPEIQIFSGFSLHMPSGTTTALVGGSGSGKSTVISLVERFYDPISGEVLIDGINLKTLRLGWIREKIGLVSQEPVLFTASIGENIGYGKSGATLEDIRTAITLANAAKFIDKMPQGLDTMVGEHGTQLSGGQKQRIAIARAILKNPRILLLDEATSALDAESERIVQDALVGIMLNRTTIVVAHRLTTVRNADTIAVVQRGKLVEKGCHADLIKNPDGAYSQLVRLQENHSADREGPAVEPDKLDMRLDAIRRSGSLEQSIRRSISAGSSVGEGIRNSFSMAMGLPGPIPTTDNSPFEDYDQEASHKLKKTHEEVPLSRLACLNKPELPILLLGSLAAAVHGMIFPTFGLLISSAIGTFYEPPDKLKKDAKLWALMYIGLGAVALVAVPVQQYLFGIAGGKLIQRVRSLSFEKAIHQEISWFDEPQNSSGAIGARLSTDASNLKSIVGDALALVVQNLATVTAGLVIAFTANWTLALIVLALVPLVCLQGVVQVKSMKGFSADAKLMFEEASQVANDAVGSIRTVASFCAEQKVMDLYTKKCEAPTKSGIRQGLISGAGFGFSNLALFCTYAISFYAGARLVEDGKTTFTKVFKVFFALTMAANGVAQTSGMGSEVSKAKTSATSIFAIVDKKSKIDASNDSGMTLDSVKGDIEFIHISFSYPTRPYIPILRDFCLSIPAGKTAALVGESGSGKSTAISMLERFYEPASGQILLDGVEIQKFKLKWLREQMGLVSQEPMLFNDTIRANIAYGKRGEVSEEEIIAVSKAANAHTFISALPHGYDTWVGERGVQLSGGQKQRISIARAILKDPRILLLDEATSALDAESESLVQEALDKVMVGRSTVVVAHRLSTIKGADIIAVVKNGVIAEKGRHEVLIKITDGLYSSLVALHNSSA